jgi:16S rRNA (adenine1518-N6/adenine1519-N6)-dimethyltransferase
MASPSQTLTYLKHRFEEVGIRLETRHGQNFLIDLNLQRLIVDAAELSPNDVVLEVGTGMGSLTALVASHVAHVVTVEIDPRLHQLASEELIDFQNVTLLNVDALAKKHIIESRVLAAVSSELEIAPGRRFKLVANLPYNVATPLIANLLALDRPPDLMTITIQKELADRITAYPATKDYGALSIWVQCQCTAEILRVMPPDVFWPRPKVHSAIARIRFDLLRRNAIADLDGFRAFVQRLFLHRRKLLRVVLASEFKQSLRKDSIDKKLAELDFASTARAEELSVESLLRLWNALRESFPAAVG